MCSLRPPNQKGEDAFDPAELIEDFDHPICQICMGIGMVRDENGINMVRLQLLRGRGPGACPGVGLDVALSFSPLLAHYS